MAVWKRPATDTKFHIDYEWWTDNRKDVRVAVRGQLCETCRERFPDHRNTEEVDWVDPETAEVTRADALIQCLRRECSQQDEFISRDNSLITNVFRLLLLEDNRPRTPLEIEERMPWTDAKVILRTLASGRIFMGIRPTTEED